MMWQTDTVEDSSFVKATSFVQTQASQIQTDSLLYLYARYKQALDGDCDIDAPSFWDVNGKKKYNAWKSLLGMDSCRAKQEYIDKVCELFPKWESDCIASGGSFGLLSKNAVSRPILGIDNDGLMCAIDDKAENETKNVFYWCQKGDIKMVLKLLNDNVIPCVDYLDPSTGMALIHWASDRGNTELLSILVNKFRADVNVKDKDGQTALHYAVSCEHFEIAKILLSSGADVSICDNDGISVRDMDIEDEEMKRLLDAATL